MMNSKRISNQGIAEVAESGNGDLQIKRPTYAVSLLLPVYGAPAEGLEPPTY